MTATTTRIEQRGQRLYFAGLPFAAKDRAKELKAKWDGDKRMWWVGTAKRAAAEGLVAELTAAAAWPVMTPTPGSAAAAVGLGLNAAAPAGVVADALDDRGRSRAAERVRAGQPAQRDAGEVRLTGKGTYQGRSYYLGARTKDGQRVLILGLPKADGSYFERWVPAAEVAVTKTYQPREVWDGRRYSGRTRTAYTTLGSIADFLTGQRRAADRGDPACSACGKRSAALVHDLETGGMACRGCADMPAE